MIGSSLFDEWLKNVSVHRGGLFGRYANDKTSRNWQHIVNLCHALLPSKAETSGIALAEDIPESWLQLDETDRRKFMHALLTDFRPDISTSDDAVAAYESGVTAEKLHHLHNTSEPHRQELIRRLNFACNDAFALVNMRRQS